MFENNDPDNLLKVIQEHVHTKKELYHDGYEIEKMSMSELETFLKCKRCKIRWIKLDGHKYHDLKNRNNPNAKILDTGCDHHSGRFNTDQKRWSCCQGRSGARPCAHSAEHSFPKPIPTLLESEYQYWPTPPHPLTGSETPKHAAVVVDCEMGVNSHGDPELIRVTMIDALTQATLIDNLVEPTVKMRHYQEKITKITATDIKSAVKKGTCIVNGREGARAEVWKFVGPDTVLIGHALKNDLRALRWVHTQVLDTQMLAKQKNRLSEGEIAENVRQEEAKMNSEDPVPGFVTVKSKKSAKKSGKEAARLHLNNYQKRKEERKVRFERFSLKYLTDFLLKREIQTDAAGHDSLEDCKATLGIAVAMFKLPSAKVVEEEAWVVENDRLYAITLEEAQAARVSDDDS